MKKAKDEDDDPKSGKNWDDGGHTCQEGLDDFIEARVAGGGGGIFTHY